MLDRHFDDFQLHCITDDICGIDPRVNILPLPPDQLDKWWWKMWLFNEEWMVLDDATFLDLDLIIQHPFKIEYNEYPTLLDTWWIDKVKIHEDVQSKRYLYCGINSSVISWNRDTKRHHIWEEFLEYKEMIPCLFKGIDNFIQWRLPKGIALYDCQIAYSFSTNKNLVEDKPLILFDWLQDKQDKHTHIDWVNKLWS